MERVNKLTPKDVVGGALTPWLNLSTQVPRLLGSSAATMFVSNQHKLSIFLSSNIYSKAITILGTFA